MPVWQKRIHLRPIMSRSESFNALFEIEKELGSIKVYCFGRTYIEYYGD